ncbi:exosortase R [Leifsonia poae]|uniref:exosortase R n=1 Tax=Leifsonia poae TaxID=110933 RepID=UPI003D69F124
MSTAAVPPVVSRREARTAQPAQRGPHWLLRLPLALALAAVAIALFITERTMRGYEIAMSGKLLPFLFASDALTAESNGSPIVLFKQGDTWLGLRMTAECSIAFYVGAILLFAALMMLIPRFAILRVLLASAIAVTTMVLLNQVRLAALAWVFGAHGRETFEWAHSIGGSVLMIGGLAVTLTLFFFVVVRGGRRARQARKDEG